MLQNVFVLSALTTSASAVLLSLFTKDNLNIAFSKIPTVLPYIQQRSNVQRKEQQAARRLFSEKIKAPFACPVVSLPIFIKVKKCQAA